MPGCCHRRCKFFCGFNVKGDISAALPLAKVHGDHLAWQTFSFKAKCGWGEFSVSGWTFVSGTRHRQFLNYKVGALKRSLIP